VNIRTVRLTLQFLALFNVILSLARGQGLIVEPADIIVIHGRVYTEDAKQPWAQAVAIRGAKIVAVGDDANIEKMRGMGTKVINAAGKLVLPGFTDCHVHFLDGSLSLGRVNLAGAKDVAEIQKRLREYVSKHPDDDWILGRGWKYNMFGPEALPHKKYLDELFPDRPVFLEGHDGRTYWANSKALALAGITRETPNPPNGIIVRDPLTGEASGALKESAQDLVTKVIPKPTRAEMLLALRAGMKKANEYGITRVHSTGGDFESLDLFQEMRHRGDLSVRMYVAYFLDPPLLRPEDLKSIEAGHKKFHDEWIDAGAVKFVLDDVVESHTAAMLEPYSDDPSLKGKLFWEPQNYTAAVTDLDKRGLQLLTDASGDYGVRVALDAYENAEQRNRKRDRDHRSRIEHIETIATADIPRFGQLGVIASMQPFHSYPDSETLDVWTRTAGPERTSRAWAWGSIWDAGGRLTFGSDWPVVTLNPWQGIQTAVTRQTAEGTPEGGFVPAQRVSVERAVDGYTLGAAFAGRREKTEGSLETDKLADLIIVSQNIFDINPHKIGATKVVATIVGGRLVYQADSK
jgi:predicted amidohydrolase YtcJ